MAASLTLSPEQDFQLREACAELDRQLRTGETRAAEAVLAAYPKLAADADCALQIIYDELVRRERLGEQPAYEEYYQRFPQWQEELRKSFDIHEALVRRSPGPGSQASPLVLSGPTDPARDQSGWRRYELLGEIGRGGMGIVYKARQAGLNRIVALKMILAGSYAQAEDLIRFRTEAEATARLQHPNIVQVFEVGEQDGRPYLALEYVDGGSLQDHLAEAPLPASQAAELVATLARAVHYAHERGVLHRDLKPANILLQTGFTAEVAEDAEERQKIEQEPARLGEMHSGPSLSSSSAFSASSAVNLIPKITDFGLAKCLQGKPGVTGRPGQTESGAILGTPSYMAPEQAEGQRKEIGPATDVYALGAVLYECLTGRPPFKAETPLETMLQVWDEEPVPPRRLQPKVPRDLETICLKCLEKEPPKRYGSARELAEDLERFQAGDSIQARPASPAEKVVKWARRRPAVAGLLSAVVLLLVVGLIGLSWLWRRAEFRRGEAVTAQSHTERALRAEEQQRQQAERNLYFRLITLAHQAEQAHDLDGAERFLNECPPAQRQWEWYYLKGQCQAKVLPLDPQDGPLWSVAFDPDGRRLWTGSRTSLKSWDANTGKELGQWVLPTRSVIPQVWALSPDGQRLAASTQSLPGNLRITLGITVYEAGTFKELHRLPGGPPVAFSPDGQRLVTAGSQSRVAIATVKVYDVPTGRELQSFPAHLSTMTGLAFSADGRLFAAGSMGTSVRVWDTVAAKEVHHFTGHTGPVRCVSFHPDGRFLASASDDKTVRIWDLTRGTEARTLCGHTQAVHSVRYSPNGQYVASAGADRTIRFWGAKTGQELRVCRGHTDVISSLAFSPDGQRLASGGLDGTVRVWPSPLSPARTLSGVCVVFRPDGRCLTATVKSAKAVEIQDVDAGRPLYTVPEAGLSVMLSPGGNHVVLNRASRLQALAGPRRTELVTWDTRLGSALWKLAQQGALAFSPDGQRLVTAGPGEDRSVVLREVATGKELRTLGGHASNPAGAAFSPDGETLAVFGSDGGVKVWDAMTGEEIVTFQAHRGAIRGVAFSPDGLRLATGGEDRAVHVWETATGQLVHTFQGHTGPVVSVAFHPEGKRLVSGDQGKTIKLWDLDTLQDVLSLSWEYAPIRLVFSPDGGRLAAADGAGSVHLWNGTAPREEKGAAGRPD